MKCSIDANLSNMTQQNPDLIEPASRIDPKDALQNPVKKKNAGFMEDILSKVRAATHAIANIIHEVTQHKGIESTIPMPKIISDEQTAAHFFPSRLKDRNCVSDQSESAGISIISDSPRALLTEINAYPPLPVEGKIIENSIKCVLKAREVDAIRKLILQDMKFTKGITLDSISRIIDEFVEDDEKHALLNTLVSISDELTGAASDNIDHCTPLFDPTQQPSAKSHTAFPFIIGEEGIAVSPPTFLGKGALKVMRAARLLNDSSPIELALGIVLEKTSDAQIARNAGKKTKIKMTQEEADAMDELHLLCKNDPRKQYLALPFKITHIVSSKDELGEDVEAIGFLQKRYDSDARVLIEAPLILRYRAALDIVRGLACMHAQNRTHNDLKLANIFLEGAPIEGRFKNAVIGDFGGIKKIGERIDTHTRTHCSPEVIGKKNTSSTFENDCYGLGATLFELITGKRPNWERGVGYRRGLLEKSIRVAIEELNANNSLSNEEMLKLHFFEVIKDLSYNDPKKRLSIAMAEERLKLIYSKASTEINS